MRTYVNPHLIGDEYEVFYDDADGVRSLQGWYFENAQGIICGPYHARYAAEDAAAEESEEC